MSTILLYPTTHNQEDDEEETKAEKIRQKLEKQAKKDLTKFFQNVYNEEVERTTNSIFPEYRNVKSSLHRTRSRQLPLILRSFRTLHIRGPWKKPWIAKKFSYETIEKMGLLYFLQTKIWKYWHHAKTFWETALSSHVLHPLNSFMFYGGIGEQWPHSATRVWSA